LEWRSWYYATLAITGGKEDKRKPLFSSCPPYLLLRSSAHRIAQVRLKAPPRSIRSYAVKPPRADLRGESARSRTGMEHGLRETMDLLGELVETLR
jgi:hypothetical protein